MCGWLVGWGLLGSAKVGWVAGWRSGWVGWAGIWSAGLLRVWDREVGGWIGGS